jgi:opacity protein-like surface antigen
MHVNLKLARTQSWLLISIYLIASPAFANQPEDPCAGASAVLNLVDRPTQSDSACAVKYKQALLEAGFQYQKLRSSAHEENFPETELRLGLPANNELSIFLPNYVHQTVLPYSGNTATVVGLKHQIGYTLHWNGAVEILVTLPSNNKNFGSQSMGSVINGIVSYTFNPKCNLTFQLGGGTQTAANYNGGQRYSTVNPDLVFTYSPTEKIDVYGETYGASRTGPSQGSGFNADAGVLFLVLPNMAIDLEYGQRISGNLLGFQHYIGSGLTMRFG